MIIYFLIAYLAVVLTAAAQVLLKIGANRNKDLGFIKLYINSLTILGYGIMGFTTLLNLYVYKFLDLKYAVIIIPFTFLFVAVLSYFLLKEKVTRNQFLGYAVIMIGVLIFNF